ncbi:MAG: methionyl-tRNA synthetase [Bradyrhizobium sp.]|jgi:methionyl-tRNA synthetase|nr:methionyl-tRNA synthetase [Bradyrhizobium sp.]
MKKFQMFQYDAKAYNLDCMSVPLEATEAGFMSCELSPGQRSVPHNHFENEVFAFISGSGRFVGQSTEIEIAAGDAVTIDPFESHTIENTSEVEPLRFISVYRAPQHAGQNDETAPTGPVLIFSTPPTPNGDLHLGHLSGPYLAADVLRRALSKTGRDAVHATGRDDHQTYVTIKARRENVIEQQVADRHANEILSTLTACGIRLDGFIEPDRRGPYANFVRDGITRLYQAGHIYAKTEPAAFNRQGAYLHEAHIRGTCPHCLQDSDGNACEACGRPNSCTDLINPRDRVTGEPVVVRDQARLYFRLSAFQQQLSAYIKTASMSARVFALAEAMIADGLPDICISHPTPWGIQVPIASFEDQIIYVWFEMAFGYLWATAGADGRELDIESVWNAARKTYGPEHDIVHVYGFDNAYYHTLLFPAVYFALEMGLRPARTHIVNELLDLDGSKFSTSRNHLIWGRDILASVPVDYVRWGLCANRPEGNRSDFSLNAFLSEAHALFCNNLASWIAEFRKYARTGNDLAPEPGAWFVEHKRYYGRIRAAEAALNSALSLSNFSPRAAALELASFARESELFARSQASLFSLPGTVLYDYQRTVVALLGLGLRVFAKGGDAIVPDTGKAILAMLGDEAGAASDFLPPGRRFFFERAPTFPFPAMEVAEAAQ